jgi:hypothetical protein
MNNRPTPETDQKASVGLENADQECVPAEFGRKLERERDEAREYSKATWQSLRDSQDEVLRLTFENRELRNLSNE